jgi:hypothetical protein
MSGSALGMGQLEAGQARRHMARGASAMPYLRRQNGLLEGA